MDKELKNKIYDLYFEQMLDIEHICIKLRKECTLKEIKQVIDERYKNAGENIYFERRKRWFNQ